MMEQFIKMVPKAELHLHIEGSLEPEMMFALAEKNKIPLKYQNVEEVRAAYEFNNLQSFLDIYYAGAQVLVTEEDFYDLTWAYLLKAKEDGVVHTEIFFDPQTHLVRNVPMGSIVSGISAALQKAESDWGLTSHLIMCFLRHLSQEDAFKTLELVKPYLHLIAGVGLDSSEMNHPPLQFKDVFRRAREWGLKTVAHAGEEGPPYYIWQAINDLNISRIDHGVRCIEDASLIDYLKKEQIPLTVCPLSNVKLCVYSEMAQHHIKTLLEKGLCVMINSDDPAYFGGYILENYLQVQRELSCTIDQMVQFARNSIVASFMSDDLKTPYLKVIDKLKGLYLESFS